MKKNLIVSLVLCLLLTSCHVVFDDTILSEKSAVPKIPPGFGDLSGTLINSEGGTSAVGIAVHLAEVVHGDDGAIFVLDTANGPSAVGDENGHFVFSKVPTGEYIIVIANSAVSSKIITDDEGQAKIWIIQPNQVTDLGSLQR
jgi:hypothetical protein